MAVIMSLDASELSNLWVLDNGCSEPSETGLFRVTSDSPRLFAIFSIVEEAVGLRN
jgi:hypothetical protein